MAKKFDPALKSLVDARPLDWAAFALHQLGLPDGPISITDADVSSVTAQADRVFRYELPAPGLVHLELQAQWDGDLPNDSLKRNVLLNSRYGIPVDTIVMVLSPRANSPSLTGTLEKRRVTGDVYLQFQYTVVRVWELPPTTYLTGPLGLLPLAVLTDEAVRAPEPVFAEIVRRADAEAEPRMAKLLELGSFMLAGLRHPMAVVAHLFERARGMEESTTYQWIVSKGVAIGIRKIILRQGRKRFGPPPPEVEAALQALTSDERLERISDRIDEANDWNDLVSTP